MTIVGLRDAGLVAGLDEVVDDVVGVLLQGVVHRRLEVRLRAVVVDAEAAADVEALDAAPMPCSPTSVCVASRSAFLSERMSVIWLPMWKCRSSRQSSMPSSRRLSTTAHDLARRQAELRAVAARLLPAARAAARELRAHAERGPDAEALRHAQDRLELGELLDHDDRRDAELGREQRRLDVLVVLVAVADHQRACAGLQRDHGEQLGLAADLEAHAVVRAFRQERLDDVSLLVDLDREDAAVGCV